MVMSKKLKIALINVMMEGDYLYEQEIPLGLASVGAFLRKNGLDVRFAQCLSNKEDQARNVAEIEADIYGFQLTMTNSSLIKSLVIQIKAKNPDAVTIFGGPYLISHYEDILKNEDLYDFIVMGEGEATTLELVRMLEREGDEFNNIEGLVWRDTSKNVIKNKPRLTIEDLDSLPFPARDFLEDAKRDPVDRGITETIRISTSRGCVGSCNFCCVNLYNRSQGGKRWRGRSAKNVVDEIEFLVKKYGVRIINFSDSSFEDPGEYGKKRSRQICEEIIDRGLSVSAKIYLRCESVKTAGDIELLKLYKSAGVDVVIVGVEAASDYELKFYEKCATSEDNKRTMATLKDLDIFYVIAGFIMFGPNSTMETIRENMEFLHKFGFSYNIMPICNVLTLFRDSKLYRILKDEGRVIDSGGHCELPKYVMRDRQVQKVVKHWEDIYTRFPGVFQLNKAQVNCGNLVSRMTNPMNKKVFDLFESDFSEFKNKYSDLCKEFGKLQRDYFIYTIELVENGSSEEKLSSSARGFFVDTCNHYGALYSGLYNGFLNKLSMSGMGLSGLIFKHTLSAVVSGRSEKFAETVIGSGDGERPE